VVRGVCDDADEVADTTLSRRNQRQHEGTDTRVRRVTVHLDCSFVGGGRESAGAALSRVHPLSELRAKAVSLGAGKIAMLRPIGRRPSGSVPFVIDEIAARNGYSNGRHRSPPYALRKWAEPDGKQ
jgi:hypothetical protein